MSAEEHYREAERDIRLANDEPGELANFFLDRAQVHATLALAGVQIEERDLELKRERSMAELSRALPF